MNDGLITIREKGQYETYTEYLEWINKEIEKGNNIIIQKNSEISDLKSRLSSLEAEKAKIEKSKSDNVLSKTEIDLRSAITDLNKLINDNKGKETDLRINELISKVDEAIMKYSSIEEEYREIREELSKPVNTNNIQYEISRQAELEEMIKEILETVKSGKNEIESSYEEQASIYPNINNMEQAVNMVSNQEVQDNNEIPYAKPMTEQMDNYENEISNDVNQEDVNPFEQVPSVQEDMPVVEEQTQNIPEENVVGEAVVPNVAPFVNNDTIAPDASVLNSIMSQENTETSVEDNTNNVIEETQSNAESVAVNNDVQQPVVPEDAEKVEGVEAAPQDMIEQAKQASTLNASAIKARRIFLNKSKESETIDQIFNISTWPLNGVEITDEMKNYFNSSLQVENQEQVKTR